jgi:hypothetical protein
MANWMIGLR